jgi:cyclopropane fatty-acyl-phospholipid synthase-like methyltransferase
MGDKFDFQERYAKDEIPWDSGQVSAELLRVLDSGALKGKTLLEIGCGTGLNAIELARRGFKVTAVDVVEQPVVKARERARKAGVSVDFRVADVLKHNLDGPYDILFDRGVYHILRRTDLKGFQEFLKRVTRPGSLWLSFTGNSKEDLEDGPPVVSEVEIRAEWAPLFDVLDLHEFRFDSRHSDFKPLAWSVLGQRK